LDPVDEEETVDLLGHRYFRASILCRSDAVSAPASHQELLEDAHLATSLRLQSESLDLAEGTVERFVGTAGSDIMLASSIIKAAVVLLGAYWPFGVRVDRLYRESLSFLAGHDCPVQPDARRQLFADITALFEAGQIDLRLREPVYSGEIAEYPIAHALARWEAERGDSLTTPHHLRVPFDLSALELVRAMDGSRSRADLARIFGSDLVERTIPVLGRWGLLDARERMERAGS
jgi:hypothetical protein